MKYYIVQVVNFNEITMHKLDSVVFPPTGRGL